MESTERPSLVSGAEIPETSSCHSIKEDDKAPSLEAVSDSESSSFKSANVDDPNGDSSMVEEESEGRDSNDTETEGESTRRDQTEREGDNNEREADSTEEPSDVDIASSIASAPALLSGMGEHPPEDEFTNATPLPCIHNEPADHHSWDEIALGRICIKGDARVCVQAVVLQTKDGTESGAAHQNLSRIDLSKELLRDEYVLVRQPLGFIRRVTGYQSSEGAPCLLHSLRLEFASGQVIEVQGETDAYRGEGFVIQDLPAKFYMASLEFLNGKCIGYTGYTAEIPIRQLMENESLPDEEMLDQTTAFSEYDDVIAQAASKPKMKVPLGDNVVWTTESLPAREIPQPPPDEEATWRISHICLCGGPCVLGCIIHYYDGRRFGFLLKGDLKRVNINNHSAIEDASGQFIVVQQPGGHITKINGYQMGEDCPHYLCHSLQLEFASGQVIEFEGQSMPWRGKYFSYDAPEDFYVNQLRFNGKGNLSSVAGVRTELLDFPPIEPPKIQTGKKKRCPCFPCLRW